MYFTDAGIEELDDRRGDEQVSMSWLAERLRDFVDLNPEFETAVDRLASWLARLDSDGDSDADEERVRTTRLIRTGACLRAPGCPSPLRRATRGTLPADAIHLDFAATRHIVVYSSRMCRQGGPR